MASLCEFLVCLLNCGLWAICDCVKYLTKELGSSAVFLDSSTLHLVFKYLISTTMVLRVFLLLFWFQIV